MPTQNFNDIYWPEYLITKSVRFFEIVTSLVALILIVLPISIILLPLYFCYGGKPIFKSRRVGKFGELFVLYKFRSMHIGTPLVSTNSLTDPKLFMLPFGKFLRRFSIDELPQLWNVLRGELSLVGPRPCLPTQDVLIAERLRYGIDILRPGITGHAQVNGRDQISLDEKIRLDLYFLNNQSTFLYFKILVRTLGVWLVGSNVSH